MLNVFRLSTHRKYQLAASDFIRPRMLLHFFHTSCILSPIASLRSELMSWFCDEWKIFSKLYDQMEFVYVVHRRIAASCFNKLYVTRPEMTSCNKPDFRRLLAT